jgi:hypothetical protein
MAETPYGDGLSEEFWNPLVVHVMSQPGIKMATNYKKARVSSGFGIK